MQVPRRPAEQHRLTYIYPESLESLHVVSRWAVQIVIHYMSAMR